MKGLFSNLNLEFSEKDVTEGAERLLQKLDNYKEHLEKHTRPHIFIFDRDRLDIMRKIRGSDDFTSWGNSVYSFAIPIPKHREGVQRICIEFYYKDDDIAQYDENGRRLFLNTEFDAVSGIHFVIDHLKCSNLDILQGEPKIVGNWVSDKKGNNVALSKNDFADNILNGKGNFANVDFAGFKALFERIQLIINEFDSENN